MPRAIADASQCLSNSLAPPCGILPPSSRWTKFKVVYMQVHFARLKSVTTVGAKTDYGTS